MADSTGTTTYTYDLDSRQTSVTDPQSRRIDYEYDPLGNRTFMTNPYDGATNLNALAQTISEFTYTS